MRGKRCREGREVKGSWVESTDMGKRLTKFGWKPTRLAPGLQTLRSFTLTLSFPISSNLLKPSPNVHSPHNLNQIPNKEKECAVEARHK
jgi:hypothetical protein